MPHPPAGPHVVIVGGYLTLPLFYRPMRERLLARGAARVSVVPLYWPDWLAATFAGFGPAMLRTARAIRHARARADAPLLVVGHSAGGFVTRLAMSEVPFEGRWVGVANDVGCLVTLGTPHRFDPNIWRDHPGVRATRFLDRTSPGAFFAPTTGYLTVGSSLMPSTPAASTPVIKRSIDRIMRTFVGQADRLGSDGIVENQMAQLSGVPHIELRDALHGTLGAPWYGDDRVMDRWWPAAVEAWRGALTARDAPGVRSLRGSDRAGQPSRPR